MQNIRILGAGEGLEKIKSKKWAEPLGVGLQITGEIFELAGEAGVPVIGLIGKTLVQREGLTVHIELILAF